jgi:hypothetical protein
MPRMQEREMSRRVAVVLVGAAMCAGFAACDGSIAPLTGGDGGAPPLCASARCSDASARPDVGGVGSGPIGSGGGPSSGTGSAPPDDAGDDASDDAGPGGPGDSGSDGDDDAPVVSGGDAGGPSDAGTPPPPPGDASTAATTAHLFAIHRLYLGDTDPSASFTNDPNAWETFGYNLDGLVTTAQSTDVCTPYTASQHAQQVDGPNGVDNSFGSQIIDALFGGLITSTSVSGEIADGKFTDEVDTVGLDGTAGQTASGLTGSFFNGGGYGGTPAVTGSGWAQSDHWPVSGSCLTDPTSPPSASNGSLFTFGQAYVVAGEWVSGDPTTVPVVLSLQGAGLTLTIHDAVITMPISGGNGQLHVTGGKIAGVLSVDELIAAFNQVGTDLNACSIIAGFVPDIRAAADIVLGSNGAVSNPVGTVCNAISIGLELDADEIAQPDTLAAPPSAQDAGAPCSDDAGS